MVPSRSQQRTGMSIIEVAVVIGICAGLLVIVTALLVGVLQASAGNTRAVAWQQTWQRLAQAWRADVHAVRAVKVTEPSGDAERQWKARVGDVEYAVAGEEIVRIERRNGRAVAHESFRLLPQTLARFVVDEQANTAAIRITADPAAPPQAAALRQLEIVAVVGLDLRYQEDSP